jgi:hypothetical protein
MASPTVPADLRQKISMLVDKWNNLSSMNRFLFPSFNWGSVNNALISLAQLKSAMLSILSGDVSIFKSSINLILAEEIVEPNELVENIQSIISIGFSSTNTAVVAAARNADKIYDHWIEVFPGMSILGFKDVRTWDLAQKVQMMADKIDTALATSSDKSAFGQMNTTYFEGDAARKLFDRDVRTDDNAVQAINMAGGFGAMYFNTDEDLSSVAGVSAGTLMNINENYGKANIITVNLSTTDPPPTATTSIIYASLKEGGYSLTFEINRFFPTKRVTSATDAFVYFGHNDSTTWPNIMRARLVDAVPSNNTEMIFEVESGGTSLGKYTVLSDGANKEMVNSEFVTIYVPERQGGADLHLIIRNLAFPQPLGTQNSVILALDGGGPFQVDTNNNVGCYYQVKLIRMDMIRSGNVPFPSVIQLNAGKSSTSVSSAFGISELIGRSGRISKREIYNEESITSVLMIGRLYDQYVFLNGGKTMANSLQRMFNSIASSNDSWIFKDTIGCYWSLDWWLSATDGGGTASTFLMSNTTKRRLYNMFIERLRLYLHSASVHGVFLTSLTQNY